MPFGIARDLLGSYLPLLLGIAPVVAALAVVTLLFGKRPARVAQEGR